MKKSLGIDGMQSSKDTADAQQELLDAARCCCHHGGFPQGPPVSRGFPPGFPIFMASTWMGTVGHPDGIAEVS